jgi:signal transduction histidine kinase
VTAAGRVALAARAFALAAVISVAALQGAGVLRGAVLVFAIAFWAQVLSSFRRIPECWVAVLEGAAVGILAAAAWPDNDAVTPYLLVPALIGGLAHGIKGVGRVLATEIVVTSASWWILVGELDRATMASVLTWFLAGLGLGILGGAFRRSVTEPGADSSYKDALQLIKQLHALSGKLTAGLDAVSLGEQVLDYVHRRLAAIQTMLLVRSQAGSLTPLRFSDGAGTESLLTNLHWVERVWHHQRPGSRGRRVAIPLCVEAQTIAVVVADVVNTPDVKALADVSIELTPKAVQLYAAMLFGDVRDAATSEERQRLAREVHDGVAQDVASLGYVLDNLTESTADLEQLQQLRLLRSEVTRVVTELRHSVFDLRNETGAGQGLGQSLSSFARHVGSHSDLTVHVTLDESSTRLRPQVESELLRIAQEAINNARKHSGGKNLWVSCVVHPPHAHIEISDDGNGLGRARDDSHGLRIMHERAARIGAEMDVAGISEGGGTRVSVRLPARVPTLSER